MQYCQNKKSYFGVECRVGGYTEGCAVSWVKTSMLKLHVAGSQYIA